MNPADTILIDQWIKAATQHKQLPDQFAKQVIPLLDLTSLNDTDTEQDIVQLCTQAQTPLGNVAAICIYPRFVKLAKQLLQHTAINIASVANFPYGDLPLSKVLAQVANLIQDGADEIDVVIPYSDYLTGNAANAIELIKQCKALCDKKIILKVILETGALQRSELIATASADAIQAGANFIKTSTGKIAVNATLEATAIMLLAIKKAMPNTSVGFKAAGGIRTAEQAASYIYLAEQIMGKHWLSAATFRFGASSLLHNLLTTNPSATTTSLY